MFMYSQGFQKWSHVWCKIVKDQTKNLLKTHKVTKRLSHKTISSYDVEILNEIKNHKYERLTSI